MKHALIVPIKASTVDKERILFLMKCSGQLRNATLGTMISKVEQLRRDSRWRDLRNEKKNKGRAELYRELKKEYNLSEFDTIRVAHEHARESGWLTDHLDGRIINSIGKEVWTPINLWLHGQACKPRFTSSSQRTLLSGNDQKAGLRYKKDYIVHSTQAINLALKAREPLGNKLLKIQVDWENIPKKRRKYYSEQPEVSRKLVLLSKMVN